MVEKQTFRSYTFAIIACLRDKSHIKVCPRRRLSHTYFNFRVIWLPLKLQCCLKKAPPMLSGARDKKGINLRTNSELILRKCEVNRLARLHHKYNRALNRKCLIYAWESSKLLSYVRIDEFYGSFLEFCLGPGDPRFN